MSPLALRDVMGINAAAEDARMLGAGLQIRTSGLIASATPTALC